MAKRLVRWRIEGETLVDEADEERSCDIMDEWLRHDLPNFNSNTKFEEPEILGSELVDRGNK